MTYPITPPRRISGMTLIEVLVAVLILSIGLLGLAGLQTLSLRSNHSAYLRSQATILAYDIADRMRANRQSALSGWYNIELEEAASSDTSIAATDLKEWKAALSTVLPAGDGSITVNDGNVTIIVAWDDERDADNLTQFQMQTRL